MSAPTSAQMPITSTMRAAVLAISTAVGPERTSITIGPADDGRGGGDDGDDRAPAREDGHGEQRARDREQRDRRPLGQHERRSDHQERDPVAERPLQEHGRPLLQARGDDGREQTPHYVWIGPFSPGL